MAGVRARTLAMHLARVDRARPAAWDKGIRSIILKGKSFCMRKLRFIFIGLWRMFASAFRPALESLVFAGTWVLVRQPSKSGGPSLSPWMSRRCRA